jgi:hypothetical protein
MFDTAQIEIARSRREIVQLNRHRIGRTGIGALQEVS